MIHNPPDNGATAPNIAQQRQAAHQAPSLPTTPTRAPRTGKLRAALPWLAGLAIGAVGAFGVAYETMPIKATPVERMILDINGDGAPDFLVSGWVVFGPKAPASQTAGQP